MKNKVMCICKHCNNKISKDNMRFVGNRRVGTCQDCHEKQTNPLYNFPQKYILRPGRDPLLNFPKGKLFKVKHPKPFKVGLVGTVKDSGGRKKKFYVSIDFGQIDVEDEYDREEKTWAEKKLKKF